MKFLILIACFTFVAANDYQKICGDKPGKPHFFVRDPTNCQRYYLCQDGQAHLDSCPPNYLFNETLTLCDYAENVQCSAPIPPSEPEGCPPRGERSIPVAGSCTKYIFCKDGHEYERECANGTLFDENYRICKDEKLVFCNDCPVEDKEGVAVFVPDRRDCRRYYFCKNRVRYLQMCSKRLYFDETIGECKNTCDGDKPYKCPVSAIFKV